MKRIISVFLALVMCLALSACGVSGEYAGLVDALAAGDYTQVKTELSGLSDDFKAEQEQMAETAGLVEKYADVLALLEAEDYEAAGEAVLDRMPEPACTAVEISMDNWEEYLSVETAESWEVDEEGVCQALCFDTAVVLKPEYADRLVLAEDTLLAIDYTYEMDVCGIEVDLDAQTYSKNESEFTMPIQEIVTFRGEDGWVLNSGRLTREMLEESGEERSYGFVSDVAVARITGRIYLLDE